VGPYRLDLFGSRQGVMTGICEDRTDMFGSTKCRELLEYVRKY
jgi:hypothetical protein